MNEARLKAWDLDRTIAILLVMATGAVLIMASASGTFAQRCHEASRSCLTTADCVDGIEDCIGGGICLQRTCLAGACQPGICLTGSELPAEGCCAVCDPAENKIEDGLPTNPTCGGSGLCVEGGTRCVECQVNAHCPPDRPICLPGGPLMNLCVECVASTDCPRDHQCVNNACTPITPPVTCDGLSVTIMGTSGDDELNGTAGPDVIHGLGGNDLIRGLGGDDTICGGEGNDVLLGGSGNDVLMGDAGDDVLLGGSGNDVLMGDAGDDVLLGQQGNDDLNGGGDEDTCIGGTGSDSATDCELVVTVP